MPEGDTVFYTARALAGRLAGQRLERAQLRHPRLSTVELAGRTVLDVRSVGKHLFIRFDDASSLHNHLRMDGEWHLYRTGSRWRGRGHEVRAVLATAAWVAVGFRLHDMAILSTSDESDLVGHLGPDLLDPAWDDRAQAVAAERLAGRPDREVGVTLVDQRVMAGIGNLYRAEVCFLLGVSPWSPVATVDAADAVATSRRLLLRNATNPARSTTDRPGGPDRYWVYQRTGRGCLRCGDSIRSGPLSDHPTDDRLVYWCPTCQPGPGPGA